MVGELELAGLVLDRAGERAALEAEQLRLEQLGRQRRAVDLDERLVAPRATPRGRARATSSLPVPLSPRMSTVTSVSATRSMSSRTSAIRRAAAEQQVCARRPASCSRSVATSRVSCAARSALPSGTSRSASSNGLLTKSVAPSFIACTTVAVRPLARHDDDRDVAVDRLERGERLEPIHRPGITTSRMTAAGRVARKRPRPPRRPTAIAGSRARQERREQLAHGRVVVHEHVTRYRSCSPASTGTGSARRSAHVSKQGASVETRPFGESRHRRRLSGRGGTGVDWNVRSCRRVRDRRIADERGEVREARQRDHFG